jgi:3-hydroxyisobutyrate dehydrogenase
LPAHSTTDFGNESIGVAGCGAMGLPMAQCLLAAGYDVWGYDIRPTPEFGSFSSRMITDPAVFAARCPTVISVVRDARQTDDLLFADQALFMRDERPRRLIVSSTLSPRFVMALPNRLPDGTALIDAPMSGAPIAAEQGTLTFMVGGPDALVDHCLPLFRAMGDAIYRLGPFGSGMVCKVLNNYAAASSVVAVRRIYDAAAQLDVDRNTLRRVMADSSGSTWFGDNFERISWAREGYDPANTIGIVEKDVRAMLDAVAPDGGEHAYPFDDAILAGLRALKPIDE